MEEHNIDIFGIHCLKIIPRKYFRGLILSKTNLIIITLSRVNKEKKDVAILSLF